MLANIEKEEIIIIKNCRPNNNNNYENEIISKTLDSYANITGNSKSENRPKNNYFNKLN